MYTLSLTQCSLNLVKHPATSKVASYRCTRILSLFYIGAAGYMGSRLLLRHML